MHATPSRRRKRHPLHFVATCSAGLEQLVADEIAGYGGQEIAAALGAVTWQGTLESGYRACLFSRFSSRVLLNLTTFEAPDPDAIYAFGLEMDWEAVFSVDATLAIFCTLSDAKISHSRFAALKLKDAIADAFRKRRGRRPDVDLGRPDIRLNLHIRGSTATLALDLSGESLHRRGYREGAGAAPLKESLAAALVHLSGWPSMAGPETILLDPMCGSGTLLIEAAMQYADMAPGLGRDHFGFLAWQKHDANLWERLLVEARTRETAGLRREFPRMTGFDADPAAVAIARRNIQAAGFADVITTGEQQLADLDCPGSRGMLLTNPPYGERLSERPAVNHLYRFLARRFTERFGGWHLSIFTANPEFMQLPGIQWLHRHTLYNGPLKCQLLTAEHRDAVPEEEWMWHREDLSGEPDHPLANRLRKNCARLFPEAEKRRVSCFRIYDADIPEYNLAIDLYERWVHVQEYRAPATVDPVAAAQRFSDALGIIRTLLQVQKNRLFIKRRQKQKGRSQYQKKQGKAGRLHEVREHGARLLVNFTDYLDTGLFLDHRTTRSMLRDLADNRRFLNLFAYTGTATVHAALGGAATTTSVDTSSTYLARAAANLSLNGFGGPKHRLVEADCLEFLQRARGRFDLIFVDPPTFSNARHRKKVFDIQKDHVRLLRHAMDLLTQDGVLLFSTNFGSFKLDQELGGSYLVRDITGQTLPFDFTGHGRAHQCWRFTHRNQANLP